MSSRAFRTVPLPDPLKPVMITSSVRAGAVEVVFFILPSKSATGSVPRACVLRGTESSAPMRRECVRVPLVQEGDRPLCPHAHVMPDIYGEDRVLCPLFNIMPA